MDGLDTIVDDIKEQARESKEQKLDKLVLFESKIGVLVRVQEQQRRVTRV